MANKVVSARAVARDCSMCRNAESVVRSVIAEPLEEALSTWVCAACLPMYHAAVDAMCRKDRRLVVTEVAA